MRYVSNKQQMFYVATTLLALFLKVSGFVLIMIIMINNNYNTMKIRSKENLNDTLLYLLNEPLLQRRCVVFNKNKHVDSSTPRIPLIIPPYRHGSH